VVITTFSEIDIAVVKISHEAIVARVGKVSAWLVIPDSIGDPVFSLDSRRNDKKGPG
jgi:hypothetical protein